MGSVDFNYIFFGRHEGGHRSATAAMIIFAAIIVAYTYLSQNGVATQTQRENTTPYPTSISDLSDQKSDKAIILNNFAKDNLNPLYRSGAFTPSISNNVTFYTWMASGSAFSAEYSENLMKKLEVYVFTPLNLSEMTESEAHETYGRFFMENDVTWNCKKIISIGSWRCSADIGKGNGYIVLNFENSGRAKIGYRVII